MFYSKINTTYLISDVFYLATQERSLMSVFRSGLFAGKVAIVTGGGTGIGKAITTELLHLGEVKKFTQLKILRYWFIKNYHYLAHFLIKYSI